MNTLDNPKNIKSPESLAQLISDPVHFFQVGVCNGEDMLIYARQKTVSTMFTACKPTRKADQTGNSSSSGRHRSARGLFSSHGSKTGWFSTYKVNFILSCHIYIYIYMCVCVYDVMGSCGY